MSLLDGGSDKQIRMGDVRNDPADDRAGKKRRGKQKTEPREFAPAVADRSEPRENYLHVRGDFLTKGPIVEPHTPEVLPPLKPRELTKARPARPGALDRRSGESADRARDGESLLAVALRPRAGDYRRRLRHAGRAAVASRAARLAGQRVSRFRLAPESAAQADRHVGDLSPVVRGAGPTCATAIRTTRWLARQNRLRLEAEIVRDAALAASGLLNPTIGGPSVRPPQPPGIAGADLRRQRQVGREHRRRPLSPRAVHLVPADQPVPDADDLRRARLELCACTRRERSNTPLQALTLLNDVGLRRVRPGPRPADRRKSRWLRSSQPTEPAVAMQTIVDARLRYCPALPEPSRQRY